MKRYTRNRLVGGLLAGALLVTSFGVAAQTKTASGVTITNSATVDYKVGTIDQTPITSNTESFKVDALLSLSVTRTDATIQEVSPGQSEVVLTFSVKNEGNDAQGAILNAFNAQNGVANPFGGTDTDSFDITSPTVHVDNSTGTVGSYDSGDTATTIHSMAPNGGSATVFVVFDVPTSAVDKAIAAVGLRAQVATTAGSYGGSVTAQAATPSSTAWDKSVVQYVYVDSAAAVAVTGVTDAANDGYASALNAVKVKSATIDVTKEVTVVSDPSGSSTPRAVPGAVMMYTITVSNTGSTSATGITINDDLSSQTNLDVTGTATSIKAYDNGSSSAVSSCSTSTTPSCSFAGNKVTVSGLTADAGKSAKVTFEVTIK